MPIVLRVLLFILIIVPAQGRATEAAPAKVIKLATTEWCPYACQSSQLGKGIIYDYLTMILKSEGVKLELTFLPWAKAIASVEAGENHGLLSAIRSEAPNLMFTTVPTMHYKMCLYNAKSDKWRYAGRDSLASKQLGVIAGYGYGEPIDSYVQSPSNANKISVFDGDNSLKRLDNLLESKKIDVFIEDGYVVKWQSRLGDKVHFKQAGCLRPVPFYMAFNNDYAKRSNIIEIINMALSNPKFKNYLNQYMLPHYFSSKSSNWEK